MRKVYFKVSGNKAMTYQLNNNCFLTSENRLKNSEMKLTIKSRVLNKEITFSRVGKCYIFADINGKEGIMGNQICKGGKTKGSTLIYEGDDKVEFDKKCRNWYKAYIRNEAMY